MRNREELFTVSLVGYTNTGKSTLMNFLTDANVFVEDKLFATLDTRTRIWKLAAGHRCLLSDTVGFITRLPHHLVEAFHATLEEAMTADLLLHVVDASSENADDNIEAVIKVLEAINSENIPNIIVFNKIDLIEEQDRGKLNVLQTLNPDSVAISAVTGEGVELLKNRVLIEMRKKWIPAILKVNVSNGKLIGILKDQTEILLEEYKDGYANFEIFFDPRISRKIEDAAFDTDKLEYKKIVRRGNSTTDFFVPPI